MRRTNTTADDTFSVTKIQGESGKKRKRIKIARPIVCLLHKKWDRKRCVRVWEKEKDQTNPQNTWDNTGGELQSHEERWRSITYVQTLTMLFETKWGQIRKHKGIAKHREREAEWDSCKKRDSARGWTTAERSTRMIGKCVEQKEDILVHCWHSCFLNRIISNTLKRKANLTR